MSDKKKEYFLIQNFDGDTIVKHLTKQELMKFLNPENYQSDLKINSFMENIEWNDTNYWNEQYLIIKGEIIVPTEKKVVTTFEIE